MIISRVEGRNLVERFDSERCFLSKLHISAAPPEEQPDCPGARISARKVFKKYMERKNQQPTWSAGDFAEGHVVL